MFAKLEDTSHGQCLIELTTKENPDGTCGPAVRFRIDKGVTIEVVQGPFPDTYEGWGTAEKLFEKMDPQKVAEILAAQASRFIGG